MKIYYAHCIAIYSTPQEDRDVALLEGLGFVVKNPNAPRIHDQCENVRADAATYGYTNPGEAVMQIVFKPLVASCDALAFRALPDGRIPAGVAKEIQWAREKGLPVIELPSNFSSRVMSVEATREYLQEVGSR